MSTSMTKGNPLKLMLQFALPLLIGNLLQQTYNIIDAAIVGQILGAKALASVGASSSVQFLVLGFCMGCCTGFGVPVAKYFGADKMDTMRNYVFNGAVLTGGIGVTVTVLCSVFCPQILHLIRVVLCLRYPRCFKALREPLRAHAVVEAVHATEKVLHALLRHPRVGEQPFQKLPRRTIVQFRIFDRVRRRTPLGRAVLPAAARERGNDKRDTEQQRRVPLLYFRGFDPSFLFADKHQCVYHTL